MRREIVIIGIIGFLIANVYHDNKYTKWLKNNQKYMKMATIGFVGLSVIHFFKKKPAQGQLLLSHANDLIRYMPIDRDSSKLLKPVINMMNTPMMGNTNVQLSTEGMRNINMGNYLGNGSNSSNGGMSASTAALLQQNISPQMKRMLRSGTNSNSRSVSASKKKFVASRQGWQCAICKIQLPPSYEVDHIVDLQYGGSNHVDNLRALCRNCHGNKTMFQ
tara:strand:+ start:2389 stop:3045 length:657 start_codon:yes stop_codon:yes gene_type:complete